jgi:cell division initiation protein
MSKSEELGLMATTNTEARRITSPERNIGVTPFDLRQARFATSMRGFDKNEVTSFLEEAAEGFDQAMRENERLRMEIVKLETSLTQFRELEGSLKATLMSAQKIGDDMRENAEKEAQRIVRDAESRAELLMRQTQSQTEDIEREIDGLRIKRREAEMNLESTISALNNTLEFIREQDRREREDRIVQHRPKIGPIAAPATRIG